MPSPRPSRAAIAAALVATYIFWGSTFLGIRYALDSLPPFLMAGTRFLVAALVLLLFAWWRKVPRASRRGWAAAAGTGIVMLVTGNGAVVWAEQTVPIGLVALTVSTSPILMVVGDRIFFGNRVTWPAALGIGIGLAGIAVLVNPSTSLVPLLPTAVLLLSNLGWAAGAILSRSRAMPESATVGNGAQMLGAGAAFVAIALAAGEIGRFQPHRVTALSLAGLAWLIVFGSLIAFSCYLWLIRVAPMPLVATQSYVSPVVAVVLGAVFRQEQLTVRELVAGAIIISGVALVASAPWLTSRRSEKELAAA